MSLLSHFEGGSRLHVQVERVSGPQGESTQMLFREDCVVIFLSLPHQLFRAFQISRRYQSPSLQKSLRKSHRGL